MWPEHTSQAYDTRGSAMPNQESKTFEQPLHSHEVLWIGAILLAAADGSEVAHISKMNISRG